MIYPLVTIVIPVYNGSDFVGQAIESALNQTYKNIEIMVVNDGSLDGGKTRETIKPYATRVKYIEKQNGGVSSVLNFAFEKMQGEWLSWLSHDDLYYPNKIQRQIDYLNENNFINDHKKILFSNFDFIDERGKQLKIPTKNQITTKMGTEDLILTNIKRNSFGGCTFLIPKEAYYEIGGFSEKLRTISDFDYWYRLLFAGYKFCYIPEVLTSNRMHRKQVTYKFSDLGKSESIIFHKYVIDSLARHNVYCSEENFMKLAYYTGCKGIREAQELAYDYALKNRKNNFIKIKISIAISRIIAKAHYHCRSLAKEFFIKYVIFR